MRNAIALTFTLLLFLTTAATAQGPGPTSETFEDLAFRNLGGAIVSGRISDVAIDPSNRNVWYVGVSSGNVFKTANPTPSAPSQ